MSAKHTPGPWNIEYTHGSYQITADSKMEKGKVSIVADLVSDRDTKLIAASPDLLAALQELVSRFETVCTNDDGSISGTNDRQIKRALATIAKATQ